MKKIILNTLVIVITVWSCSKKDTEDEKGDSKSYALRAFNIKLTILDNQNQDLLDSLTPNYFPKQSIKVYFLNNGEKELVTDTDGNTEAASYLHKEEVPKVLELSTSDYTDTIIGKKDGFEVGRSITYLELNKGDIDTIVSEWKRKSGYFVVDKIWYNNAEEAYDVRNSSEPYRVIKALN